MDGTIQSASGNHCAVILAPSDGMAATADGLHFLDDYLFVLTEIVAN